MALLSLNNVTAKYGQIVAIQNVTLRVGSGEIVTLIGANGAGKTTLLKTISGLIRHSEGTIEFHEKLIDGLPGHKRVSSGIALVPEGRNVFAPLTVDENLLMGAYLIKDRKQVEVNRNRVFKIFERLYERRRQFAGTLSGGEQQMLAIGRALMGQPIILMLDEPSLGLAPKAVEEIFSVIEDLNKDGTTILLVEQNAQMALRIANRGYVIETGKIVLEDKTDSLLQDERVRKAYLAT